MKKLIQQQTDSKNRLILQGVDLTDSFILNWQLDDSEFNIDLEFSIWPESPYYEKPKTNEFTCYKKGEIIFHKTDKIVGFIELDSIECSIDPDGSRDWGGIYDFRKEGSLFKFKTEFTEIEVTCKEIEITIEG